MWWDLKVAATMGLGAARPSTSSTDDELESLSEFECRAVLWKEATEEVADEMDDEDSARRCCFLVGSSRGVEAVARLSTSVNGE